MKILIQCSCGDSEMPYPRELVVKNKSGAIRCPQCGKIYQASDVLERERNGVVNYMEVM